MFDKILVPVESASSAEGVLPLVTNLAQGLRVRLVLLGFAKPNERARLEKELDETVKRLNAGAAVEKIVSSSGKPADEVGKAAAANRCDLVVFPASSGPSSDALTAWLRAGQLPTLVVRPQKMLMSISSIIVSVDGSSLAEIAFPYAEELARRLKTPVKLVSAARPARVYASPEMYTPPVDLGEAAEAETAHYLKGAASKINAAGFEVDTATLKGLPGPSIVNYAASRAQSLVVMTAHGRSGLARWLMGSVTEEVLKSSPAPVLVIPHRYGERYASNVNQLLEQTPILAHLRERDIKSLAQSARTRTFTAGQTIVREGEEANGMFIIASGEVEVVKGAETPAPTVLARLSSGDFFGEMAILDDQPRSATVRALRDTECVTLQRDDFLGEMHRHPEIAIAMLPALVKRLREAGMAAQAAAQRG